MKFVKLIAILSITSIFLLGCNNQGNEIDEQLDQDLNQVTELEETEAVENLELDTSEFNQEKEDSKIIIESGDIKQCETLQDANLRGNCRYTIILNKALEKDDVDICNELDKEEEKSDCKRSFGM